MKNTPACCVSGPHSELSLCSLKPRASEEPSLISDFLSLGMNALSHMKGKSLMNQTISDDASLCEHHLLINISQWGHQMVFKTDDQVFRGKHEIMQLFL